MTLTQVTTGGVDENINIDSNTLKVDGTNNRVGIGTASPAMPLDVRGADTNANGLGDVKGQLRVFNDTTAFGSSPRAGIVFSTKYRTSPDIPLDGAAIYGGKENSSDADKNFFLAFATRDESPNEAVERMRITSEGLVGISSTSPTATLEVASTGTCSVNLVADSDNNGAANDALINFRTDSNSGTAKAVIKYDESQTNFGIETNGTRALSIDTSQQVGIGTTLPSSKLHVNGTITDSIGPIRRLGITTHNASTLTLAATHAGNLIREATSSANITLPSGVFSAGDMITIFNVSSGDNTITQGSGVTLYNTADAATGNRTLAAKGVCTIACTSTNEFIISGSGLS